MDEWEDVCGLRGGGGIEERGEEVGDYYSGWDGGWDGEEGCDLGEDGLKW